MNSLPADLWTYIGPDLPHRYLVHQILWISLDGEEVITVSIATLGLPTLGVAGARDFTGEDALSWRGTTDEFRAQFSPFQFDQAIIKP